MRILDEILDWLYSLTVAFALAMIINMFLLQPTRVMGSSMEPTLQDQDYILVSKVARSLNQQPNYGQIVILDSRVFRPRTWKDDLIDPLLTYLSVFSKQPPADHMIWVKRVVGKPGDVLQFQNGKVIRNGQLLEEPYIKEAMKYTTDKKIVVPSNHVFVLGDNRNNSSDSRFIGSIPLDHVLGNLIFKL